MDDNALEHGGIHGGAARAPFLAAGIGAFAMGLFVILNEAGIFSAPSLYGPAGGLSGRSTLAVVAWLVSWAILHARWRRRALVGMGLGRATLISTFVLIAGGTLMAFPPVWGLLPEAESGAAMTNTTEEQAQSGIPASIKAEHEAIHEELVAATRLADPVGKAARDLAAVLHPHFVREEEIALPPLGALQSLAQRQAVENADAILDMTDSLRAELPRMLQEHVAIKAAVQRLRDVATTAGAPSAVELADALALHARTEEEVLYPAALVVGDMLRRTPPVSARP